MPNLGGDDPNEFDRAAARADTPGPIALDPVGPPASGVRLPEWILSPWPAAGICCTGGVPISWAGIGEARRAVDSARGVEAMAGERPRKEPGEVDMGTAAEGGGDNGALSGFDMFAKYTGGGGGDGCYCIALGRWVDNN